MEQLQARARTAKVGRGRGRANDGESPWFAWFGPASAFASVVLHVGGAYMLTHAHAFFPAPAAPRIVEFALTEVKPPPPPPPPKEIEKEPPKPKPAPLPEKAAPRPQAPEKEAPPPQMTGRTLTDPEQGDKAWSSLTGNGEAMKGPLVANPQGSPTGTGTVPHAPPPPPAPPPGPRFVAVGDLSRAPRPPNLDDALERNYPKAARNQGIGGNAVLRAQILPDGRIGVVRRTSETFAGFGEACERTLRSGAWSAPIDRAGLPVGTEITYTCRFDVRE